MSQPLTISLTDSQFAALAERAAAACVSPEAWILEVAGLNNKTPVAYIPAAGHSNGIQQFFGTFASGDPDSANNERIDADVGRCETDESSSRR
jgi:hypothetical protein